jgi:hypothetical protein
MLPSLNPALLYYNLRDVFKSHARARVTYINTCDSQFPQHAAWGSPTQPPDFLKGNRVSLSSTCSIGHAAADIASFINGLSVHVLVDPMGWGSGHRQDVLVHRPAPVQLGAIFPAAHASKYMQYNILDARVSPPELAVPVSPSFTRPMLLPFYSPTQHSGTYGGDERLRWDAAASVAGVELLVHVWSAWWGMRGVHDLHVAEITNVILTEIGPAVPCDGALMMVPAKGFKWDDELAVQWLRAAADVEATLASRCNDTRPLLNKLAASHKLPNRAAFPPRVLLVFMNWTSIDRSIRSLHAVADMHGVADVSREHVVVLPRVDHADYMRRCGEAVAVMVCNALPHELFVVCC